LISAFAVFFLALFEGPATTGLCIRLSSASQDQMKKAGMPPTHAWHLIPAKNQRKLDSVILT
jgi:hypothetical protein